MNVLIIIGLAIVGLIALFLIVALFAKKDYLIEREIVINKPKPEVFKYISHIKNQDNYSKWNMADPDKKTEYVGVDGTTGFVYKWDSKNKNVGAGEQEIKKIVDGDKMETEVRFLRPFEGVAKASFYTDTTLGNQTKVKWVFENSMKFPMNAMGAFMNMEKILGNDMAIGLNNLKNILEK